MLKWLLDRRVARRSAADKVRAQNRGVLVASGLIAGEALTGVVLAGIVMLFLKMAQTNPTDWAYLGKSLSLSALVGKETALAIYTKYGHLLSVGLFTIVAATLVWIPTRQARRAS